jgi:glycosyltransferase involved in cell wall biosynthesis
MKRLLFISQKQFLVRLNSYNNNVQALILSPPVDVEAFRKAALYSKEEQREDIILVVSRFSPDKQVENAIRIAKVLSDRKNIDYKMIIIGSICKDDVNYLLLLKNMLSDYNLKNCVKLEIGSSFEKLLYRMSKSRVYLHPVAGEPFGISVAEAMAAGLIPVVPYIGGNSEFVPPRYHYRTLEEAAEIIKDALLIRPVDYNTAVAYNQLRTRLSNLTLRFSIENYKYDLKKIISTFITKTKQIPLVDKLLGSQKM